MLMKVDNKLGKLLAYRERADELMDIINDESWHYRCNFGHWEIETMINGVKVFCRCLKGEYAFRELGLHNDALDQWCINEFGYPDYNPEDNYFGFDDALMHSRLFNADCLNGMDKRKEALQEHINTLDKKIEEITCKQ